MTWQKSPGGTKTPHVKTPHVSIPKPAKAKVIHGKTTHGIQATKMSKARSVPKKG